MASLANPRATIAELLVSSLAVSSTTRSVKNGLLGLRKGSIHNALASGVASLMQSLHANSRRRATIVAVCLIALLADTHPILGQSSNSMDAASSNSGAFNTPPSFERVPSRVSSRASNLASPDRAGQASDRRLEESNRTMSSDSFRSPSDDEWLPKPTNVQPVQTQVWQPKPNHASNQSFVNNSASDVQQANYTVPPTTEFAPVRVASDTTKKSSANIPLKPPSTEATSLAPTKSRSTWASAISMIFSLVLVIAIFLGLSWMFRKTSALTGAILPKEVVEIIGRTPMANRQQLYVIRFGRKLVLVSQQIGQTEVLSEIDDRTEVDHLLGLCEQTNSRGVATSFRNVLQQVATTNESKWALRQRRNTNRATPGSVTPTLDTHS